MNLIGKSLNKMNASKEIQSLKYFPLLGMLIITAQLAASVLGPRTILIGPFLLPGGIWSFPLTFFLWDIVTEVYGFQRAKQLIWYYLFAQIVFALLVDFGYSLQLTVLARFSIPLALLGIFFVKIKFLPHLIWTNIRLQAVRSNLCRSLSKSNGISSRRRLMTERLLFRKQMNILKF